jgi:hypothetical protein
VEEIRFPGYEPLLTRFLEEVRQLKEESHESEHSHGWIRRLR